MQASVEVNIAGTPTGIVCGDAVVTVVRGEICIQIGTLDQVLIWMTPTDAAALVTAQAEAIQRAMLPITAGNEG